MIPFQDMAVAYFFPKKKSYFFQNPLMWSVLSFHKRILLVLNSKEKSQWCETVSKVVYNLYSQYQKFKLRLCAHVMHILQEYFQKISKTNINVHAYVMQVDMKLS